MIQSSLICALLAACGGGSDAGPESNPEDELRDWVDTAEARAEDKDRGALLSMISDAYVDGRGNDREKIGNLLRVYFLRQQDVAILTSIDDISLMGNTAAQVNVTVGMAGTNASALGVQAHAYNFEFELEKPDEEWLLIGARWGRVGGDLD
jgi:hypothetical protein